MQYIYSFFNETCVVGNFYYIKHDFMLVYASIIVVLIANKQEEETL